jgi:bifunctional non-homologous end joining protein LigD
VNSDTFPIVAFVEKLGARPRKIASLYVGHWEIVTPEDHPMVRR